MSDRPIRWGIVSTIKAPLSEILGFAAYHLQLGAHRLYIYLDAPEQRTVDTLKAHPKIRVTATDDAYWRKKGGRPDNHQPRQTKNAADAYAKRIEVDWLCHIDCDEFLTAQPPLSAQLGALPDECLCARVRPMEALEWAGSNQEPRPFKGFALPLSERRAITQELYPTYGTHLNGGFLSHVAGKMIYRTGVPGLSVKIHNAFLDGSQNPGQVELADVRLCHMHGADWNAWITHFEYRHARGAYRAELAPPSGGGPHAMSMHQLLGDIADQGGRTALRAFYDEVCSARPDLLRGLEMHGLLHWCTLDLGAAIATEFPDFA